MKSWSQEEICELLENMDSREYDTVGIHEKQIKLLCEFSHDWLLHQFVSCATRKHNLLDLAFTNDSELFTHQEIIGNILLSYHCIVIIGTCLESEISIQPKFPKLIL